MLRMFETQAGRHTKNSLHRWLDQKTDSMADEAPSCLYKWLDQKTYRRLIGPLLVSIDSPEDLHVSKADEAPSRLYRWLDQKTYRWQRGPLHLSTYMARPEDLMKARRPIDGRGARFIYLQMARPEDLSMAEGPASFIYR
jgi:hypothetical protein